MHIVFKGARSYFSKFSFLIHFDESLLQSCKFEILVETVKPFGCMKQFCVLQLPISYTCVSSNVTITRHIFQTVHFLAVKFDIMGHEKNMSYLMIPNSPKV